MKKKQSSRRRLHAAALYSVFGIYLMVLFALLFGKRTDLRAVNLVPFRSIADHLGGDLLARSFALNNIGGNIALFVPLGVYVALLGRSRTFGAQVGLIALLSAAAETAQYVFRVGVTDIDDVLLNTVGGAIGILAFRLLRRLLGERARLAVELLAPLAAVAVVLILR